jgi:phosphoglycolate phosphatase
MKLSVLSNKAEVLTQAIARKLLSAWKFEIILGHDERFPRKPDPASAKYVAERMQTPPERILYVGDTAIDMRTAHAAGMFPVGVTWGFRSRAELVEGGAQRIIDKPEELLEVCV